MRKDNDEIIRASGEVDVRRFYMYQKRRGRAAVSEGPGFHGDINHFVKNPKEDMILSFGLR